jgi:hypothetical protein
MTDKLVELEQLLTAIGYEHVDIGIHMAKKKPENAQKIIDFINKNHLDCHNCWVDLDRYPDYEKLTLFIWSFNGLDYEKVSRQFEEERRAWREKHKDDN